jgi:hypothetical protein
VRRILIIGALATCAGVVSPGDAATETRLAASSCLANIVQYQAYPNGGVGTESLPWVQATPSSAMIVGQLFYYQGTPWQRASLPRARIYTRGRTPTGGTTKILWHVRGRGDGLELTVYGKRLDKRGSFTQHFPTAGGDQFPSIVQVPSVGCWQLQLTAGAKIARVTFLAVKSAVRA